jgi:hypothetical protein
MGVIESQLGGSGLTTHTRVEKGTKTGKGRVVELGILGNDIQLHSISKQLLAQERECRMGVQKVPTETVGLKIRLFHVHL